jgi:hypothetical protein
MVVSFGVYQPATQKPVKTPTATSLRILSSIRVEEKLFTISQVDFLNARTAELRANATLLKVYPKKIPN